MGIGAAYGMTRIPHTAIEKYNAEETICALDANNGFNKANRKKMLDAVKREADALAPLFWMGYCQHQPFVLFRMGNRFHIILTREGAKMGDKFGSFVFDITIDPGLRQLKHEFPEATIKAATDDITFSPKLHKHA